MQAYRRGVFFHYRQNGKRVRRIQKPTPQPHQQGAEGKWHYYIDVVEHTKSEAGYRTIYVVAFAVEVLEQIRQANLKNDITCDAEDYIFLYRGERIMSQALPRNTSVIAGS